MLKTLPVLYHTINRLAIQYGLFIYQHVCMESTFYISYQIVLADQVIEIPKMAPSTISYKGNHAGALQS